MLLSTSAIAALGVAACNGSEGGGIAGPAGEGPFGFTVGEPVAVISATRSDGTSFDEFTVTFENEEGTLITIGTPEGEDIVFDADDPDAWIGEDPRSRPWNQLARVTSVRGDVLEVFLGEAEVPTLDDDNVPDGTDDEVVLALARMDEADTRDGFETYMVTGLYTDPDDLPRYSEDDQIGPDDDCSPCAGDFIEGQAYYSGNFNATVFKGGNVLSDTGNGWANVTLDFASAAGTSYNGGPPVTLTMGGRYTYDDLDDTAPNSGIAFVPGTLPTYAPGTPTVPTVVNVIPGVLGSDGIFTPGTVGTDGTFTPGAVTIPTTVSVVPGTPNVPGGILGGGTPNVPTIVTVTPGVQGMLASYVPGTPTGAGSYVPGTPTVPTQVSVTPGILGSDGTFTPGTLPSLTTGLTADAGDTYDINLSSIGDTTDISFEGGQVTYTGALDGTVEIPTRFGSTTYDVGGVDDMGTSDPDDDVQYGEFAGAVFGGGAAAYAGALDAPDGNPYVPNADEIIGATAAAGVFEAGSELDSRHEEGLDPTVEIVGSFAAEGECHDCP